MIERDRALNQADADEAQADVGAKAVADWMAEQQGNPLISGRDRIFLTGGLPEPE
jgi:hypothetical protein